MITVGVLATLVAFLVLFGLAGVGPFNPGGFSGQPGMSPRVLQTPNNFLKSPDHYMTRGITIDKSSIDSGNTPTTKLRPGLVLVRVESGASSGKWVPLGNANDPGAGNRLWAVILFESVNMLSHDMVTVQDANALGVVHGRVDNASIFYGSSSSVDIDDIQGILDQVYFE